MPERNGKALAKEVAPFGGRFLSMLMATDGKPMRNKVWGRPAIFNLSL